MAISGDGTGNQYIAYSIGLSVLAFESTTAWSIAGWVYVVSASAVGGVCGFQVGTNFLFIQTDSATGNIIVWCSSPGITVATRSFSSSVSALGKWVPFAVTFNSGTYLLYCNGVAQGGHTWDGTNPTSMTNADRFLILNDNSTPASGNKLNGYVEDIAIWGTTLTASDVAALALGADRPGNIRPQSLYLWAPCDGYGWPGKDYSGWKNFPNAIAGPPGLAPSPPLISAAPIFPGIPAPAFFPGPPPSVMLMAQIIT